MGKRRALVVALVVVAAVVAVWWWRRAGRGPSEDETAELAAASASTRAKRASLADYQPARLAGRVISASTGQPLAGALVSVGQLGLDFGARGKPGQSPEPIVATTDAGGEFSVDGLPPGRWSASATATGHQPATVEPILLVPGETTAGIELRLSPGGSRLEGTVADIGGGAVAGALVRATRMSEVSIGAFFRAPFTARTDTAGRYALDLADGSYYLQVNHADYVREDASIELRGPQRKDFSLTPGGIIEGVVRTRGDDKPVAGALVSPMPAGQGGGFVLSGVGFGGSVSDHDGRFSLRGLQAGAIELRAMAPGLASTEPTTVELGIAEQMSDVVLYVDRAYSISGTVVARTDRKPIAGALVGAYNLSPGAAFVTSDPSDDLGAFVIHGVRPGYYSVGAAIDRRVPNFMAQGVTITDEDLDGLVVELESGATLRGRIEPPGAASLWVELDGEIGLGNMLQAAGAALVSGRADAAGVFELAGVPSGKLRLHGEADDGSSGELAIEVSGDMDGLVVALKPRGMVAGVVVDDGGQPVGGVEVQVTPTKGEERFRMSFRGNRDDGVTTAANGHFEVRGLEDGGHDVTVHAGGQLSWAGQKGAAARKPVAITIAAGSAVRDLRLVIEGRREVLRGIVLGPEGVPAIDAWVTATFIPPDGQSPWGGREGGDDDEDDDDDKAERDEQRRRMRRWYPSEDPVLTDDGGRFEVKNLRRGTYDLRAELPAAGARGALDKVASGSSVTIRLDPQAVLTGRVSRAGAPVTSFVIEADGETHRREQFSNPDGKYRIARLAPGDYSVSVTSPAGRSSAKATLAAGGAATLDFQLVAYGSVRGVVLDASSGKPLTGLSAWANTDEGGDMGAQAMEAVLGQGPKTDAEGRFRVDKLGAGKGTLMILGEEGFFEQVATKEFVLQPGQDLDLGTLKGTVSTKVPEEKRGTLGFQTQVGTWSSRPGAPGGEDPAPAGMDVERDQLWVSEVTAGGPASRFGVAVGDRISSVNGVSIDDVGPQIGAMLLGDKRIAVGASFTLGIARPGAPATTITVVASALPPPPPPP